MMDRTKFLIDLRRLGDLRAPLPSDPFSELNHHLLVRLGALDGVIPRAAPTYDWSDPALDDMRAVARRLARDTTAELADPRLALTFPFWRTVVEDSECRVIGAPPIMLLESLEASAALWEVYALSALHALAVSEASVLETRSSDEDWAGARCLTDAQRALCDVLRRPWDADEPHLDAGYIASSLSTAHGALQRHLRDRMARVAEFLGHTDQVRGLAAKEYWGLQAEAAELALQVETARAAVRRNRELLREGVKDWLEVENVVAQRAATKKWQKAHRALAQSWSFRVGRAILWGPRLIYLRGREISKKSSLKRKKKPRKTP